MKLPIRKLTHLDLFSGIGGFTLAAEWAGFRTIGFSEIEPYACSVLKKHWPNIKNYGDIRNVPTVRCDIITGGFPCQPFSVAGKQRGAEDDRHLWPAMLDVIQKCRPTWVLGENVVGFINMELDNCCADLENIGYEVQPLIIPACAVGALQHRERIWICAHSEFQGLPRRIQNNSPSCGEKSPHAVTRNGMPESWNELESHCRGLLESDGLSCAMVRNEVKCYGNSIVPQVAFEILKGIMTIYESSSP